MTWDTIRRVQSTQQRTWRAGRFWWDWPQPSDAAAHTRCVRSSSISTPSPISSARATAPRSTPRSPNSDWTSSGRSRATGNCWHSATNDSRVAAELRKRGVSSECDVLAELLVDEICAAKAMILDETILDADVVARLGLVELITEAFGAGIAIGDRQ